jgi:hypothetical protein
MNRSPASVAGALTTVGVEHRPLVAGVSSVAVSVNAPPVLVVLLGPTATITSCATADALDQYATLSNDGAARHVTASHDETMRV